MNHHPTLETTNVWIDEVKPERVRNVPTMQSTYVRATRETFQAFSIPFFSCTITECRNAVAVSHGISAAFSTGSQAQNPPQPTSTYAQWAPSSMPTPRNAHAASVQRRVETIQRASRYRASSAAMQNANGIASPT